MLARRKGKRWYLGAMNNETARTVKVTLAFLGSRGAEARIWTDGAAPDAVALETRRVASQDQLTLNLASTGGAAAILEER